MNSAATPRQSNVEILRIVCMVMIMCHHFMVHTNEFGDLSPVLRIFNALCYVAVNCFVMISGYFRIKLSPKRLLYYIFFCIFYALLINCANRLAAGGSIGRTLIRDSIFVFTHNQYWWFITTYLMLMLISPLLNAGIETLSKRKLGYSVLALLTIDIYLGWWTTSDFGYSFIHFISIYVVAAYISRCGTGLLAGTPRLIKQLGLLVVYLTSMLLWNMLVGTSSAFAKGGGDGGWVTYNHPLVYLGSIAFFLLFLTFSFRSRIVNFIAKSVLAAYFLQEGIRGVYPWFSEHLQHPNPYVNIFVMTGSGIALVLIAVLVDQLRVAAYNITLYTATHLRTALQPVARRLKK